MKVLIFFMVYIGIGLAVAWFGTIGLGMIENGKAEVTTDKVFLEVTEKDIANEFFRKGLFYKVICLFLGTLLWPIEILVAIRTINRHI